MTVCIIKTAPLRPFLLLLALTLACSSPEQKPQKSFIQTKLAERALAETRTDSFTLIADRGRVLGDPAARVWVTIVSDFQCAPCKQWHQDVLPLLRKEYAASGRVRLAFVHFPQAEHLNAQTASIAATCAAHQGKFWEAADFIFSTQARWMNLPDARPYLDSVSIAVGVNAAPLRLCTERAQALKLIRDDIERSRSARVDSLPTFFIGTRRMSGAASIATLRTAINAALAGQ